MTNEEKYKTPAKRAAKKINFNFRIDNRNGNMI